VLTVEKELILPPGATAPREARAFIAGRLVKQGHAAKVSDAKVITSELVTNAVRASDRLEIPCEIIVCLHDIYPGRPCIEVWDHSPEVPTYTGASDRYAEAGRGLAIVRGLALSVDWCLTSHGKCVWAVLK